MQVGALGALSLSSLLRANSAAVSTSGTPKSVVILWLGGGPPGHETFDPKPDLPAEMRGINGVVKTSIPGVLFGADFPELAKRMDRLAVVRSFQSTTADHAMGHKIVLSGGGGAGSPSIGSVVSRLRGTTNSATGMPNYTLISDPKDNYNLRAVGQGADAGKWSNQFNPFQYIGDFPTKKAADLKVQDFEFAGKKVQRSLLIENMELRLPRTRLDERAALLAQLDRLERDADRWNGLESVDKSRLQAFDVLRKGIGHAFDLSKEDPRLLARYDTSDIQVGFRTIGYHPSILGKQMLLARRMCEAGCGLVLVQSAGWDFHNNDATPGLKAGLAMHAPELDRAASAFLDDVRERGLGDQILLIITGEMGRTPRIEKEGRNHWATSTPLVLAGGGIRVGQVIGESTRNGGEPKTSPYKPSHLMASVMRALHVDSTSLRLRTDVPREVGNLVESQPIGELF